MRLVVMIAFAIFAAIFLIASAAAASGTNLPAGAVFFLACGGICGLIAWLITKIP